MRLGDLVDALGFEPMIIMGRRPGEKMDEALYSDYEATKVSGRDGARVFIEPLSDNVAPSGSGYESSTPDAWLTPSELRQAADAAMLV